MVSLSTTSQAPKSKQIPMIEIQNFQTKLFWLLGIGTWNLFGIWNLGFESYAVYC
jgi:hypothetical protein